ncbi:hypothetical protein KVT40_007278 [Elsinoe batatas]|uniref:Tr-type G domain-containing protein n=1 Tax=Elsinoe batatas TaxID=2601811 RepID=A0A8K0KXU9_9PEZI|nr:hypothetical protein KVT40_007278 [Elsinoe batatas]
MASIFTFDPDIPRVSSPWAKQLEILRGKSSPNPPSHHDVDAHAAVSKLEREPQEGPVEYKLHLLLRPRRAFSRVSRQSHLATGPKTKSSVPTSRTVSETSLGGSSTPTYATNHYRKHRLEQLTTQLLWRLQQSSTNHASSASNVILPHLPIASAELQPPPKPAKLIHGLEESQGALYEIGVADDGTFVGLSEDEMRESINNLRAMAACLGCEVDVLRRVTVGEAEWLDDADVTETTATKLNHSKLIVAEVLVKPCFSGEAAEEADEDQAIHVADLAGPGLHSISQTVEREASGVMRQLRISMAGGTSSGKSSLLGTLTTSALDNARGKSRLSTLKHRHEIDSGLTSSVSQELIGYRENAMGEIEVFNYAAEDITSWIDIHNAADGGRLVLLSDSAGHPRYRRTAVKGLVGWAPHWTLLCVPGNDMDGAPLAFTPEQLDISAPSDTDLSTAYMDLCLRLGLPIAVVITKLDASSKNSLRSTLANLLTLLKEAGRRPVILPAASGASFEHDTQILGAVTVDRATQFIDDPAFDPSISVPIVMTSAVQGTGIETLHALLSTLPVTMPRPASYHSDPLFHIEDIYTAPSSPSTTIVAGLLRHAPIYVGTELAIGPFSLESEDSDSDTTRRRPSSGNHSRSFPGAIRLSNPHTSDEQEWRRVRVTSIRNLRLPVKSLQPDQVGTVAFEFLPSPSSTALSTSANSPASTPGAQAMKTALDASPRLSTTTSARVRKGMILSPCPRQAASTIIARFSRDDLGSLAVGSQVVLYMASVRSTARVVSAAVADDFPTSSGVVGALASLRIGGELDHGLGNGNGHRNSNGNGGGVEGNHSVEEGVRIAGQITHEELLVTFSFEGGREFVEGGAKVLVMPGGGPGVFGGGGEGRGTARLEGFVGGVVDVA